MTKELVIAGYSRDYDWVSEINSDVRITVYNKNIETLKNNEIYLSDNVGRDVHTFFYHIVKNYHSLADFTFFSQDYPFDHVPNYIEIINSNIDSWNLLSKQRSDGCWFFSYLPVIVCDKVGNPAHPGLPIEKIWDQIFDVKCPDNIYFTAAGHFCVSRESIHTLPLEFYKNITNILETDEMAPWVIERLEPYFLLRNI